ncbi:hypothetical protein J2S43_003745 [Catenuloplanes nepalensis]|uniref:Zinc finger CGNR domain-containing protein n=1 Tax=Catenuloplanes nepalensis TaxID=587533 RepID=A0ABT9MUV2_9ACTN|nr:CGNR zinc finger domain-containing protein [Catenuloplanes nepalensis]MDP9795233.1 hypothetical protein [Catenuloplanes nepalensis]
MDDLALVEAFLNTVDERTFRRHGTAHTGGERLTSPGALSDWLVEHDLPPDARLDTALQLRTALRASLKGEISEMFDVLHGFPLRLRPGSTLRLGSALRLDSTLRLGSVEDTGLGRIVEAVARATVTGAWARMRLCAAPDCRWAFHDTSKNGAGRWCSMTVCGNRAKTRAYRQRLNP